MSVPLVYAVTVHYNSLKDTIECLESLLHQTYPNLKVLFVDNASKDGGPKAVADLFPQLEQVLNPSNLGATGGFNTGLQRALEAGADYIYLVNNDTIMAPDVVELLVQASLPEDVGISSPMIYYADAPDTIWSAGGAVSPLTMGMTDHHGRKNSFGKIVERDFLTGCAMLFKRSFLEKVGLFDNLFFCYYDDSDMSLRARKAGYRLLLVPQAKIWHKVSLTSGGSDSPLERFWMGRGSILYFRKHALPWQWIFIVPWRTLSTIKTLSRLLLKGRAKSALAYLQGMWAGLKVDIKESQESD